MKDTVTRLINRSADTLMSLRPERTSIGAVLGLAIYGLLKFFAPLIGTGTVNINETGWYFWPFIGIAIVNIPTIFYYVTNKASGDDRINDVLHVLNNVEIEPIRKEELTVKTLNHMVDSISKNEDYREDAEQLRKKLIEIQEPSDSE